MYVLDDYAETLIAPRISMVSGVSQVQVQGAQKYAVRVQVDPDKLHAAGHRPQRGQPGAAELERQPADRPAVRRRRRPTTSRRGGQLMNADAFRPVVVAYRNGAPVRLDAGRQRHRQRRGQQERVVALHARPARSARSTCQVMRQPGSNTIEVTDAIRALLPSFEAQLPPSVHLTRPRRPLEEHPRGVQRHPGDDARHAGAGGRRHLRSSCTTARRRSSRRWRCRSRSSAPSR